MLFNVTVLACYTVQWAGELCRVNESDQGQFVKACNVPSIILSAYLSTQQQQQQLSPLQSTAGVGQSQAGCRGHKAGCRETRSSGATSATGATGVQCIGSKPAKQVWRPLLLIVPLRLGLSKISEIYYNALKVLSDVIRINSFTVLLTILE